jgi:hypothetical protein
MKDYIDILCNGIGLWLLVTAGGLWVDSWTAPKPAPAEPVAAISASASDIRPPEPAADLKRSFDPEALDGPKKIEPKQAAPTQRAASDSAPPPARLVWHKNTDDAVDAALESGKPIVLLVVRKFDPRRAGRSEEQERTRAMTEYLTKPYIQQKLSKFECAWLDPDTDKLVAEKFQLYSLPVVAFSRPHDEFDKFIRHTARVSGDEEAFSRWLDFVIREEGL